MQFSPQNAKNCFLGLWSFKIFWGTSPPEQGEAGESQAQDLEQAI